ncbi:MAG: hypothetical protein ACR2O2_18335, partial [Ruegeria sp.]
VRERLSKAAIVLSSNILTPFQKMQRTLTNLKSQILPMRFLPKKLISRSGSKNALTNGMGPKSQ